jgi:tRNA(Ile)-lysidine synthase
MSGPHRAIAATRLAVRKALVEIREVSRPGLVLVACSGGADSLSLAAAVAFEAPRAGVPAGAVIVDHDLQTGSRAVAERAADQCRGLGLDPVEIVARRVEPSAAGDDGDGRGSGSGSGSGPEARARDARYGAFEDVVERLDAVAVLLGHTRDDQAEQVLLGLARGSGARSLSGMPARRGPYVRPLLGVSRTTTRAACEAAGLTVWVDPQNSDPAYGRVRARALLPILEIGEQVDGLRAGGIAAAELLRLPRAIRTRVWRLLAVEAGCSPGALIATHIDSLDTLVTCWRGQGPIDLPGRVQGRRTDGRVVVASSRRVE